MDEIGEQATPPEPAPESPEDYELQLIGLMVVGTFTVRDKRSGKVRSTPQSGAWSLSLDEVRYLGIEDRDWFDDYRDFARITEVAKIRTPEEPNRSQRRSQVRALKAVKAAKPTRVTPKKVAPRR